MQKLQEGYESWLYVADGLTSVCFRGHREPHLPCVKATGWSVFAHSTPLGAADTHLTLSFRLDDSASAASSMEVTDRIASLEQRVQMQEDDIQLLKSALADVVRRLNITEEQQAVLNRKGPTKGERGVGTTGEWFLASFEVRIRKATLVLAEALSAVVLVIRKPWPVHLDVILG